MCYYSSPYECPRKTPCDGKCVICGNGAGNRGNYDK
jgi:hypothetical protein